MELVFHSRLHPAEHAHSSVDCYSKNSDYVIGLLREGNDRSPLRDE